MPYHSIIAKEHRPQSIDALTFMETRGEIPELPPGYISGQDAD